jgi:hypothetical protein
MPHTAKINDQRIEWGIVIAAINAAATTSVIATLVLSLVGLWVTTQLRIWRYVPRAHPRALPSRTGWPALSRGAISGNDFPDTASM